MVCLRRSPLRSTIAFPAAALAVLLVFVVTACQPIQAPEATDSEQFAGATEAMTVTSSVDVTDVVSDTQAQPDAAAPTEIVTVTGAVTSSDTDTVTVEVETTSGGGEASSGQDAELVATGLAVYRAQYCGVCHMVDAAETRGTFGPPHNGMGATAVERLADPNYHGRATTPHEYIVESLVDPLAYIVPGYAQTSHRMPIYTHLTAGELDALAAFLLAQ